MQVVENWSLKCSIAWLDWQNRKFPPILIITEAKNAYFFVYKRTGFVHQELRDFVKMTLSRVIDCDSSRVILWKTWLESSDQESWLGSGRVIDSSHAITASPCTPLAYNRHSLPGNWTSLLNTVRRDEWTVKFFSPSPILIRKIWIRSSTDLQNFWKSPIRSSPDPPI